MINLKLIISIIAVILSIVGYGVYVRDILNRKTVPHLFTFLIWTIASGVVWGLQVYGGAGVGSYITGVVTIICAIIFLLSFKYGEKNITKLDIFFLLLSFVALLLWVVVNQPVWSVILAVTVDVLGFGPTIRKSWNKPNEETVFTWALTSFRHGLGIFALAKFNILTLLYPVVWTLVNALFCVFLIYRKRQIQKLKNVG